jgi:hypothetical protein
MRSRTLAAALVLVACAVLSLPHLARLVSRSSSNAAEQPVPTRRPGSQCSVFVSTPPLDTLSAEAVTSHGWLTQWLVAARVAHTLNASLLLHGEWAATSAVVVTSGNLSSSSSSSEDERSSDSATEALREWTRGAVGQSLRFGGSARVRHSPSLVQEHGVKAHSAARVAARGCSFGEVVLLVLAPAVKGIDAAATKPPSASLALFQARAVAHVTGRVQRRKAAAGMHIVVSHFKEDPHAVSATLRATLAVPGIAATHPFVVAYTKDAATAVSPHVDESHRVANIGREGDAYLRYILAHYTTLPPYILFTQAKPNLMAEDFLPRLAGFNGSVRMLPLSYVSPCSCDGCFHASGVMVRIREVYVRATGSFCPGEFYMVGNGQFLVHRTAITSQPLSLYSDLMTLLHANATHWVAADASLLRFGKGVQLSEDNPLFVHVLERTWGVIFGCHTLQHGACLLEDSSGNSSETHV